MRRTLRYVLSVTGLFITGAMFAQGPGPGPPPPDPPCWPPPCVPIDNGVVFLIIAGAVLAGVVLYRSVKVSKG